MSDMSRTEAISILKKLKLDAEDYGKELDFVKQAVEALRLAIASLETDEAYQLIEEQPEFCEDCISREYVEEMIDRCYAASWNENDFYDRLMAELKVTPSVLPKADKSTIIDWNNCHTPEQLDSIATTKNDLGVDYIKKSDAINIIQDMHGLARADVISDAVNRIITMPSVTPQEPKTGHWIEEFVDTEGEVRFTCSCCGKYQLFDTDFCYNCGAKMEEVEE